MRQESQESPDLVFRIRPPRSSQPRIVLEAVPVAYIYQSLR